MTNPRAVKLSEASLRILREANKGRGVDAYMQRRRPVERVAALGLLRKTGLMSYVITDAGRAALRSREGE